MHLEDRMTGQAPRKSFGSDNHAGTHPDVMRAIVEANAGDATAYGADPWTEQAIGELRRLSGAEGEAYLVLNGSGANVMGLGLLLGRHEAVICAETAHINTDECGAAERILGTKLLTVPSANGKITPELLAGRAPRDQGILRGQPAARLPGRRPARERGGVPRMLHRRDRLVRGRAQLRRHQERRHGGRGRDRDARGGWSQRAVPPQAAHAALVQDALSRGAVQRAAR